MKDTKKISILFHFLRVFGKDGIPENMQRNKNKTGDGFSFFFVEMSGDEQKIDLRKWKL